MFGPVLDVFVFQENTSFIQSVISPDPNELWTRCLMISVLILFALYASHLLKKQIKVSKEQATYFQELEDTVSSRTKDLQDEIKARMKAQKELEIISTTDPLTSLFNQRKFSELLKYEVDRERRYSCGLFLMTCDIDNFNAINENFGRNIGDAVLKKFSILIQDAVRTTDTVARWSGEKFVFLFTNTDVGLASTVANKIRAMIELSQFNEVGQVTASFGVAIYASGQDDENTLMDRADQALCAAEENGRNRVVIHPGD